MINICFTLVTFPFFINILIIGPEVEYLAIYIITGLTFGPAFHTIFEYLDVFYEGKGTYIFRNFFSLWVKKLKKTFFYWLIAFSLAGVNLLNILYFKDTDYAYFNVVFTLLFIWISIVYVNVVYFSVRNPKQPIKNVLIIGLYYSIIKWYRGIINLVLLFVLIMAMIFWPPIGFFLLPGVIVSLIYFNSKKLLIEKNS